MSLSNFRFLYLLYTKFNYNQNSIDKEIKISSKKFVQNNLYSNMTDWNPAEIIGNNPKPLASSLYEELITNKVWAKQRYEFGFQDLRNKKLLQFFCGKPYVNVGDSLNSFIPRDLPKNIRLKKYFKFSI